MTHQARDNVGPAARRMAHDNAHGTRRIGLRPCDSRYGRESGSARRHMQKNSTVKVHDDAPKARPLTCRRRLLIKAINSRNRARRGPSALPLNSQGIGTSRWQLAIARLRQVPVSLEGSEFPVMWRDPADRGGQQSRRLYEVHRRAKVVATALNGSRFSSPVAKTDTGCATLRAASPAVSTCNSTSRA